MDLLSLRLVGAVGARRNVRSWYSQGGPNVAWIQTQNLALVNDWTIPLSITLSSFYAGKDNYPAYLIDNVFNEMAYAADAPSPKKVNGTIAKEDLPPPLNVGYYHK